MKCRIIIYEIGLVRFYYAKAIYRSYIYQFIDIWISYFRQLNNLKAVSLSVKWAWTRLNNVRYVSSIAGKQIQLNWFLLRQFQSEKLNCVVTGPSANDLVCSDAWHVLFQEQKPLTARSHSNPRARHGPQLPPSLLMHTYWTFELIKGRVSGC